MEPEYFKISKDAHQKGSACFAAFHCVQQIVAMESGDPPQCSLFCKDCMKYKRVCSEHEICILTGCVVHGSVRAVPKK